MTTLSDITDTLTTQFAEAVTAVEKLHVGAIDDISAWLQLAQNNRQDRMKQIREAREEAAAIIAQTLRDEEESEAEFRRALQDINTELAKLRGTKSLATKAKMKAIKGEQSSIRLAHHNV